MKKEIAKKWVRALRAKKYKRGAGYLKVVRKNGEARHCCLGVLCELYQAERKQNKKPILLIEAYSTDDPSLAAGAKVTEFGRDRDTQTLPLQVQRWAGMRDDTGQFAGDSVFYARENVYSLAGLNDHGCSFAKIADIIEERVTQL